MATFTLSNTHIDTLKTLVGEKYVLTEKDDLLRYGRDWTNAFPPAPSAIVLPATTDEVVALVKFANENNIAIVASGGRTGLSGGAVAMDGELVLALDRMNSISDFNAVDMTVHCGAGVITQQLQEYAESQGLFYPVDFASAGSSQIGGNIATNAGGIKVIRYGMTRDWVAGLTVVTGTGEVLQLNQGLLKNNAGYDLRHLMIGSEGTLGIITEATMQLTQASKPLSTMVIGVPEFADVMQVLQIARKKLAITAFEFFTDKAMRHVMEHSGQQAPFETPVPFYALLEFEQTDENYMDAALEVFEQGMEHGAILDGVISQSEQQSQNLWRLREGITESIAQYTPYKNDLSVVVSEVPAFLEAVDQVVTEQYPDFESIWFGHLGDGNLHLSILKPENLSVEDFQQQCNQATTSIFDVVKQFNGSISAEHGVGLLKKPYLAYTRSEAEIALMKQMKAVFDPNGVLNPGKIF